MKLKVYLFYIAIFYKKNVEFVNLWYLLVNAELVLQTSLNFVYFPIIQWRQSNYKFVKTQKDMPQFLGFQKPSTLLLIQKLYLCYEHITHRCHLRSLYKM